jgi:hypothetical protein
MEPKSPERGRPGLVASPRGCLPDAVIYVQAFRRTTVRDQHNILLLSAFRQAVVGLALAGFARLGLDETRWLLAIARRRRDAERRCCSGHTSSLRRSDDRSCLKHRRSFRPLPDAPHRHFRRHGFRAHGRALCLTELVDYDRAGPRRGRRLRSTCARGKVLSPLPWREGRGADALLRLRHVSTFGAWSAAPTGKPWPRSHTNTLHGPRRQAGRPPANLDAVRGRLEI